MNIAEYIHNNKIRIIVKPNSNKTEIIGCDEIKNAIKIAIKEPADKNKANKELIRFVSKKLKEKVRIKSGLTSKEKILEIC